MTVSSIISIAFAFLKLANMIFGYVQNKAAESVGEDREKLRQLVAMQSVSNVLKEVDERFEKMTDEEVLEEITKAGDWRD